jgi:hypothetical protein
MEVSGQLPAPTALPTGKETQVLTGCDALVGHRHDVGPLAKRFFRLCQKSSLDSPVRNMVTISTELSRLLE